MSEPSLGDFPLQIDDILAQIAVRIGERFRGVFGAQTVERYLFESYLDLYRTARIRRHLPALAERFAVERLTALAQTRGALGKPVPGVLFVCAYNAGRSQLAAALAERYGAGRVQVRCAGSHPADWLDENVLEALGEWDIEVMEAYPKPLTDEVLHAADVIVTMGCGDACPILTGKRYVDWPIPDPAGQPMPAVRRIRDDIDLRVRALIDELTAAPAGT
ncbi:three-helix bundle dimerization domain-containing protein [Dactylosporangium sp. CA-139066]|uniref:arsenate reductase/protein-tyrosine-phosphatase family protein n=1 Tax=Dactylosporangium sp. CA-139066 TaxID=3239930 RepID=UPI003D91F511